MKKSGISAFAVGAAFIGTVIGAGFASGRELFTFFGRFGTLGIVGAALSGIAFGYMGCLIMLKARRKNTGAFDEIIGGKSKVLKNIVNGIIIFFAFGTYVVMLAGTGAMVESMTELPPIFGNIFMLLAVILTAWLANDGVLTGFNIAVPVMIIVSIISGVMGANGNMTQDVPQPIEGNWLFSAMLFVSYNMASALAVLAPLSLRARDKKTLIKGGLIGGGILGIVAIILTKSIINSGEIGQNSPMPLLEIARGQGGLMGGAYSFVLLLGIFTTAAGVMFAMLERLGGFKGKIFQNRRGIMIIISILGLFAGMFGFKALVSTLYPLNGIIGFLIIALLFIG